MSEAALNGPALVKVSPGNTTMEQRWAKTQESCLKCLTQNIVSKNGYFNFLFACVFFFMKF